MSQDFSCRDTTGNTATKTRSYKQKITCCSKCVAQNCPHREPDGICYLILEDGEKITKTGWLHS